METKKVSDKKPFVIVSGSAKEFEWLYSFLADARPNGFNVPKERLKYWKLWKRKLELAIGKVK